MNKENCPVCGVSGRTVGETTKHFESDMDELLREARAEVYEEAADTFRSCGETAVSLAYLDKAKEMRGK